MTGKNKRLRNDILLAAVLLAAAALLFLWLQMTKKTGAYAVVTVDGRSVQRLSLEEDGEYVIGKGEDWENVLVIKDGHAFMKSADCPDQICVEHRPISGTGESIICLPHKVVVSIEAEGESREEIIVS